MPAPDDDRLKARVKARLLGLPESSSRLGRFVLHRTLGRGSGGVVYEALDPQANTRVALKVLLDADADLVRRFKQEFRALADVVHENLVQLYELFVDGDEWYFSMELVRGSAFTEYVADGGASHGCDSIRLRSALAQLLAAVRAIHEAGKLHGDLKPANVLVTETGRVVVLDFGLAMQEPVRAPAPQQRAPSGTPVYMAPELATGARRTAASDAYAIGVMLFRSLTGRFPFHDDSLASQRASDRGRASLPSSLVPGVPADLDELCRALLEHDPTLRPSIQEAQQRLGTGDATATRSGPRTPVFVGRQAELAVMSEAYDALDRTDTPIAIFIRGPSGIGKSALVDYFIDGLGPRALVLRGRCHERESLPYKAFDGLNDALVQHLRGLPRADIERLTPPHVAALHQIFPELGRHLAIDRVEESLPLRQLEVRSQAFAALKILLQRIAQQRALVLVVDDLQWSDLDSARLLLELLGPPRAPTLLYIGCYRSDEEKKSEFLRAVMGDDTFENWHCPRHVLTLQQLDYDDSKAMALELLRGRVQRPEATVSRIAREALGLPFFIRELASYFARDLHGDDTRLSLAGLLSQRVAALAPGPQRALFLLALAGRPVPADVLGRALGDPADWQRDKRGLELAGLVRSLTQGELVMYHDRLREQVVRQLMAAQAAGLHRALAEAYERGHEADPEWLIDHWAAAGEPVRAHQYAVLAAGLSADKLAFNRAAALYQTALELGCATSTEQRELHEKRGEMLVNAGRGAEAAVTFLTAADGTDGHAASLLRCRAAQQYLRSGHSAEAMLLMRGLLAQVGLRYPEHDLDTSWQLVASRSRRALGTAKLVARQRFPELRQRLEVLRTVFRELTFSDPKRGALFQSQFHEAAIGCEDREAEFLAQAWRTYGDSFVGGYRRRVGTVRQIRILQRMAANIGSPYSTATLKLVEGASKTFEGLYSEAFPLLVEAKELFRDHCRGTAWEESIAALLLYGAAEVAGPIAALTDDSPMLARRAAERDDHFSQVLLGAVMVVRFLARDEPLDAQRFIQQLGVTYSGELDVRVWVIWTRNVDVLNYLGDGVAAWQVFDRMWPAYLRSGYDSAAFVRMLTHARRAFAALSASAITHDRSLQRIALRSADVIERSGQPESRAVAASLRAAHASQRGKFDEARRALESAVDLAKRSGMRLLAVCYERQLGRLSPGPAGNALIERADTELRAAGVANPARWAEVYAPGVVTPLATALPGNAGEYVTAR